MTVCVRFPLVATNYCHLPASVTRLDAGVEFCHPPCNVWNSNFAKFLRHCILSGGTQIIIQSGNRNFNRRVVFPVRRFRFATAPRRPCVARPHLIILKYKWKQSNILSKIEMTKHTSHINLSINKIDCKKYKFCIGYNMKKKRHLTFFVLFYMKVRKIFAKRYKNRNAERSTKVICFLATNIRNSYTVFLTFKHIIFY